jgi:LysM repeat protein
LTRPRLPVALASLTGALLAAPLLATLALAREPIVVRPGDTLTAIARRHDVAVETLVELNGLADPNRIQVGQRLRLEPAQAPAVPAAPAAGRSHIVQPGEHLTGIARRYGVSIGSIAAANGINDPSRIFAGQRLTIPGASAATAAQAPAAPAAPAAGRSHIVQPGEHLTGIARRYGVSIGTIAAANGINDPSRIFAGQRLTIPGASAATAAPPAPARAQMPASMAARVGERDAVGRVIIDEAYRYGISAAFVMAVAWQESGWRQGVVSHAGAIGVMQLLPSTAQWVGDTMLGTRVDPYDLRENVRAGTRLLAHYLDRYDGDRALTLAAYYQGPTAVANHGIYPVSRPYIAAILALEAIFSR